MRFLRNAIKKEIIKKKSLRWPKIYFFFIDLLIIVYLSLQKVNPQ